MDRKVGKTEAFVDSSACIEDVDGDPFFTPLANDELLPSSFYFIQLSQVTALLLSISLTYFSKDSFASSRLVINSVALLGLLALLISTRPYRKAELFSMHIQISLIIVAYLVTLTGFASAFISPGASLSASSGVATFMTEAASPTPRPSNATMVAVVPRDEQAQLATRILAYMSLIAICITAFGLIISFFWVMKLGAANDAKRLLASSSTKQGSVGASRQVIYSLASVLQSDGKVVDSSTRIARQNTSSRADEDMAKHQINLKRTKTFEDRDEDAIVSFAPQRPRSRQLTRSSHGKTDSLRSVEAGSSTRAVNPLRRLRSTKLMSNTINN
jgi:membrane associated rhomboid family serine protease